MHGFRWCLPGLLGCFFSLYVNDLPAQSVVFESGRDGYSSYRIPAMVALPNGDILAFCEGRVHGAADFGDVDIVMKRSADGGKIWSALQLVVDNDDLQAGNPAPVLDLLDPQFPQGRLFLFYNTGNQPEQAIREGKGLREVWYISSTDGGKNWSPPVNITAQTHIPEAGWRSYAITPGHALQLTQGLHKGRVFVAANHSEGEPKPDFTDYYAHGFFTDNHGKTFEISQIVPLPGSNEATAAELPGGGLLMNMRNQSGQPRQRIVARSDNRETTWDTVYFDAQLPDPVCQGTLLNLRHSPGAIAFCNAASTQHRDSLTLRISFDGGFSWPQQWLVDADPRKPSFTAYNDLVELDEKTIGVLYEQDNYRRIVFKVMPWKE